MRKHKHKHQRGQGRRRPQYGPRRPKHNIPVNVEETPTSFIARVFCVGFPKDRVKVQIVNHMIYISGTREPENKHPDFLLQEYPIHSFERWFEISEKVDQKAVKASFENGILVITAPKTKAARAPERDIPVE